MSELVKVLYPLPDVRRTPLSSLAWWESRRLTYNLTVGGTGLVTLAGVFVFWSLPPSVMNEIELLGMLAGAVVYGIAANVCYSLGWITEMLARAAWGREAPELGPLLFRQGLIFSVGLTLMPLFASAMFWVLRVVLTLAS